MKNFVLVMCSVLGFAVPTLAIEGEAGTGKSLEICRADCEKNQSVSTSEYLKCTAKCDSATYEAAPAVEVAPVVPAVVEKAKPKAPANPPAPATTVANAKKQADAPKKTDAAPAPKKTEATPAA